MSVPSSDVTDLHRLLEEPSWAPWLRFSVEELAAYHEVFPDGQFVNITDGGPVGMLTSILVTWSGDVDELPTWDALSGRGNSIADAHDPEGNTMVFLSSSVHPEQRGRGVLPGLIEDAGALAARLGLDHLIGPFRPNGFGAAKAAGGSVDFAAYVEARQASGLPVDPWLRTVSRLGARWLGIAARAMTVTVSVDEFDELRSSYEPSRWFRLDPARADLLIARSSPEVVGAVDEVWECGETGSWFVDHAAGRASYVEDNVWGELPVAARRPKSTSVPAAPADRAAPLMAAARRLAEDEVVLLWLDARDPRAEVVRALELQAFPEIEAFLDDDVERWCRFLVVVDVEPASPAIGHVFRVSGHRFGPQDSSEIGMPTIDEIIEANPEVTLEEVFAYYEEDGFDLRASIAIETSLRVDAPRRGARGVRWSDIGYVELFREANRGQGDDVVPGVFAHVNQGSVRSLAGIGIQVDRFLGRDDLRSPAGQEGTFDDRYFPAFISGGGQNGVIFRSLDALAPRSFHLDRDDVEVEVVVDVRDGVVPSRTTRIKPAADRTAPVR